MNDKPEALLLAGQLESGEPVTGSAAAVLRRLHKVNQELLEALDDTIGMAKAGRMVHVENRARAAIAKATGENT